LAWELHQRDRRAELLHLAPPLRPCSRNDYRRGALFRFARKCAIIF
jgi:hypothetical protein